MRNQVYNPFLPIWETIPDGEPHVFEGRLYLFGSHDMEGGQRYCQQGNYVSWSAPTDDLSDWRYEGVIFEAKQDPRVQGELCDLYAPDVVRGNDGRYYLYYCISGGASDTVADTHNTPIGVAVCNTPAGRYEYLGFVRNPDGSPYLRYLPHDPAVINDNGTIRLYHGYALSMKAAEGHGAHNGQSMPDFRSMSAETRRKFLLPAEEMLFHRSAEELATYTEDIMGANVVNLADDMLTVCSEPKRILPGQLMAYGTEFEGHAFYEASSIRKVGERYYFIYSDENSHSLAYAISRYPDRDFQFGGVLISNGDVGLNGRKEADRLSQTANNHGSIEQVNGRWYVFYHRHTHNSTFSRQACAEPVEIAEDGSIVQVPCTSCGLNGGALKAEGNYPAVIACNLTNGHMPHLANRVGDQDIPYITHSGEGKDAVRFIANIQDGTWIVYKYFAFSGPVVLTIQARADGCGYFSVRLGESEQGKIDLPVTETWAESRLIIEGKGEKSLELCFHGDGSAALRSIGFLPCEEHERGTT